MFVYLRKWLITRPKYSSHIDTTATQALIDTRTEIERWTDYPVEVRPDPSKFLSF